MKLNINDLHVKVNDKKLINGLNLEVYPGEVHAIMGPNGSGKSTLCKSIVGHSDYEVTDGTIIVTPPYGEKNVSLLDLPVHERSLLGVFLAFQYPVEIAGVSNFTFLKEAYNALQKYKGLSVMDDWDFNELVKQKINAIKMSDSFLHRSLNTDFSGGEKKRNEILQMMILEPSLCLLDETDSGLDVDSMKLVAHGVNLMRSKDRSMVLVTHYQRLLDYIKPDVVHILYKGQIIKSGTPDLALYVEKEGYDNIIKEWEKL